MHWYKIPDYFNYCVEAILELITIILSCISVVVLFILGLLALFGFVTLEGLKKTLRKIRWGV